MARSKPGFDTNVAARTRTADHILNTADLLAAYLALGGLRTDLEEIKSAGLQAEAYNQQQGAASSVGKAATLSVLQSYTALQREYALVMAVAQAVRGDLPAANAAQLARLDDILANRAQLAVSIDDVDGQKKRTTRRQVSQEAVRAEIERDATALLAFADLAPRLDARRCPRSRLERLQADAKALAGKLADRVSKKGAVQSVTDQEQAAVSAQRARWGASYRLLAALAQRDTRVAQLLKDAAR